ncbi:NLI interacting factor-like phosphatase [Spraguea lophii 42_110]|uniref:protein-serine/threonine phosphatase n=1 Tax=Spraguea lophii (strain 42_110) TaxID=1358809 RepID=S7WB56_SPRLO|nr:NLI interacting factor-like phosphatase [Spraguea lophii 42_110]
MACSHPISMNNLCAVCGEEINNNDNKVCALSASQEIYVNKTESKKLIRNNQKRLEKDKKLILVLDLDQTLIDTGVQENNFMVKNNNNRSDSGKGDNNNNNRNDSGKGDNRSDNKNNDNKNTTIIDNNKNIITDKSINDKDKIKIEVAKRKMDDNAEIKRIKNNNGINNSYDCIIDSKNIITTDNGNINTIDKNIIDNKNTTTNNIIITPDNTNTANNDNIITTDNNDNIITTDIKDNLSNTTYINTVVDSDCYSFNFIISNYIFYVRLRPHLLSFLEDLSKYYVFYIYSMGTREYVNKIVEIIDPKGIYFKDRIITRDENHGKLVKNMKRVMYGSKSNSIILDDREDVWAEDKNVMLIRPYKYFNNNGRNIDGSITNNGNTNNIANADTNNITNDNLTTTDSITNDSLTNTDPITNNNLTTTNPITNTNIELDRDNELLKIKYKLLWIHKKHYSSKSSIYKIYRKMRRELFKNLCFRNNSGIYMKRIIERYGGKVVYEDYDFFIGNSRVKDECVISEKWVMECIYQFKIIDYEQYIIYR